MRGLAIFLAYVLIELALAFLVASFIGWFAVIVIFVVSFFLGCVILGSAGRNASDAMRQASQSGQLPPGRLGDSAMLFLAGVLVLIPGFLTDLVGLLLLIPPVRKILTALFAVMLAMYVRRKGYTVTTSTTGQGIPETRVAQGDVIQGDVISRKDDFPQQPGDGPRPDFPNQRDS